MQVKIKLFDGGKMPTKKTAGAAAYDCYVKEKVVIYPNKPTLVSLGFALEIPQGYCAKIIPRSSIGLKTKIREANGTGLIDCDYRGEVSFIAELKDNMEFEWQYVGGDPNNVYTLLPAGIEPITIEAGDRICQMLIEKVEETELVLVDELSDTERGIKGFGSTGR